MFSNLTFSLYILLLWAIVLRLFYLYLCTIPTKLGLPQQDRVVPANCTPTDLY